SRSVSWWSTTAGATGIIWMQAVIVIQGKVMENTAHQKRKQIRRPNFGHDPERAKPVNLEKLLENPKAIPVLASLDRHGLLTNGMIQDLHFRDHREENQSLKNEEAAMKRQADRFIIKLKDAELIERRAVEQVSARGFPYPYPFN